MFKLLILYLLLIHILNDYYFQTERLAENKRKDISRLFLHGIIYLFVSVILIIPFWSFILFKYIIYFSIAHFIIDLIKHFITRRIDRMEPSNKLTFGNYNCIVYAIDQMIHLCSILVIAFIYFNNGNSLTFVFPKVLQNLNINGILSFIIMILLVMKPVNVTFKVFFSHIKPSNEGKAEEEFKVGKVIGSIERILVSLLLLVGQYTAIGLIFTAKSITRYNKISEDQKFAEYYLLGTLFSMLSATIIYLLLFKL